MLKSLNEQAEQGVWDTVTRQDNLIVYAVVYGNYEPDEVDSLWDVKDVAKQRAELMNESLDEKVWRVKPMKVYTAETAQEADE